MDYGLGDLPSRENKGLRICQGSFVSSRVGVIIGSDKSKVHSYWGCLVNMGANEGGINLLTLQLFPELTSKFEKEIYE